MGNREAIEHFINADLRLKKVIESVGELRIYRYSSSDVFLFFVREIVG